MQNLFEKISSVQEIQRKLSTCVHIVLHGIAQQTKPYTVLDIHATRIKNMLSVVSHITGEKNSKKIH